MQIPSLTIGLCFLPELPINVYLFIKETSFFLFLILVIKRQLNYHTENFFVLFKLGFLFYFTFVQYCTWVLKIQYIRVENCNKIAHYDAMVQQGTYDIFVFFKNIKDFCVWVKS